MVRDQAAGLEEGAREVGGLFHKIFEAQAASAPDATALQFHNETLTYEQLDYQATKLGNLLRHHGAVLDGLVGVCTERGFESFIFMLGVLKAGGAFLHIDPEYPAARIKFLVNEARLKLVLTSSRTFNKVSDVVDDVTVLQPNKASLETVAPFAAGVYVAPGNLAYAIYTSGSTGEPKAAMLTHAGLSNLARVQSQEFGIQLGTRVLQFSRLSFDGVVTEMAMTLSAGGVLCISNADELTPGCILASALRDYGIEVVTLPPSALVFLAEFQIPNLRTIISAGEACPPEVAKIWATRCELINAYGPTEATVCATFWRCSDIVMSVPIGLPMEGIDTFLLDKDLNAVDAGSPAELFISGVGLARGYLHRAALTADRFLAHPFSRDPGARLYRTGDVVRRQPNGLIEYIGRVDHQVKLRGFRIELGEIEAALVSYPSVLQAAVIVREDVVGDKRLVAYVVEATPTESHTIRVHLGRRLPDFMIPSSIVSLERMPLSINGKVDRDALPRPQDRSASQPFVLPVTSVECQIASIWQDVLGVSKVGIYDDFKELGGHSLLAVSMARRLRDAFRPELSMEAILSSTTIYAQARLVEASLNAGNKHELP